MAELASKGLPIKSALASCTVLTNVSVRPSLTRQRKRKLRYCKHNFQIKIIWNSETVFLTSRKRLSYDAAPEQCGMTENFAKLRVPILLKLQEDCRNLKKKKKSKGERPFSIGSETSDRSLKSAIHSAFFNRCQMASFAVVANTLGIWEWLKPGV